MAKKIETSPSLTHNPFAALSPGAPSTPAPIVPLPLAESPLFAPKLVVRRETKGRAGKTVTRISGVHADHREAIATRLKKHLGCGATLEGDDVILLGALVDRAADWLLAEGARKVTRAL